MRYIGLDLGHKRTGVALSDPRNIIGSPLGVISTDATGDAQLEAWIQAYTITALVVGIPKNRYGLPTQQTEWVYDWIKTKKEVWPDLAWHYWNEAYSTQAVESVLLSANMTRQKRKAIRDKQAAAFILQGYLDCMNRE